MTNYNIGLILHRTVRKLIIHRRIIGKIYIYIKAERVFQIENWKWPRACSSKSLTPECSMKRDEVSASIQHSSQQPKDTGRTGAIMNNILLFLGQFLISFNSYILIFIYCCNHILDPDVLYEALSVYKMF